MAQLCCYRVWDGSHKKFRRTVLILAVIDLLAISAVIVYVTISLYKAAIADVPVESESSSSSEIDISINGDVEERNSSRIICGIDDDDCNPAEHVNEMSDANMTRTARFFPQTPYFQVVGERIARSIQLIIFTCQFAMTISLIRGVLRTDTLSMRTWLIVTEIITTLVLLILVLYLFGSFKTDAILILGSYIIYQFVMIRAVARFIRRTEIELTQFGSIVEF